MKAEEIIRAIVCLIMLPVAAIMAQQGTDGLALAARSGDQSAVAQLRTLADSGDAAAEYGLGLMYDNGEGVRRDAAQALIWFRKAAEQGDARAQFKMGGRFAHGGGVPRDAAQAFVWYKGAAEQGDPVAQNIVALMLATGDGVRKDPSQAFFWYQKAAELGYPFAQNSLGLILANGNGVAKDPAQAAAWFRKAADQGLGAAKLNLTALSQGTAPIQGIAIQQGLVGTQRQLIPLKQQGGVYLVSARINDVIDLGFVVDSGAADVSLPSEVVLTLMRTGTITSSDFVGTQTYTLADGSTIASRTFVIKSLRVGNRVLENVHGSVSNVGSELLLGQSFLSRFKSWSVDNEEHVLVLEER